MALENYKCKETHTVTMDNHKEGVEGSPLIPNTLSEKFIKNKKINPNDVIDYTDGFKYKYIGEGVGEYYTCTINDIGVDNFKKGTRITVGQQLQKAEGTYTCIKECWWFTSETEVYSPNKSNTNFTFVSIIETNVINKSKAAIKVGEYDAAKSNSIHHMYYGEVIKVGSIFTDYTNQSHLNPVEDLNVTITVYNDKGVPVHSISRNRRNYYIASLDDIKRGFVKFLDPGDNLLGPIELRYTDSHWNVRPINTNVTIENCIDINLKRFGFSALQKGYYIGLNY